MKFHVHNEIITTQTTTQIDTLQKLLQKKCCKALSKDSLSKTRVVEMYKIFKESKKKMKMNYGLVDRDFN